MVDSNTTDAAPSLVPGSSAASISAYQALQRTIGDSAIDLTSALASAKGAAGASAGGAALQAQGQIEVNKSEFANKVQKKADDAAAAAAVGMTPGAPSDLITTTLQEYQDNERDLNARGKMIKAKQNTSFSDDPLGFIAAQISLPFDITAYNTEIDTQDRRATTLAVLTKRFDDQSRINNTVDVNTSTTLLDGLNKIALGKAQEAAAASSLKVAELGINVANMRIAMSQQQFQGMLQIGQAVGAEQDRAFRTEEFSFRQQQDLRTEQTVQLQNENQRAQLQEKDRAQEGINLIQQRINKVTNLLGLGPVSYYEYNADKNISDKLAPFMISPDIQTEHYGPTVALATQQTQGFPLTKNGGADATRNWLTDKLTGYNAAQAPMLNTMKPEEKQALQNKELLTQVAAERNNIPISGGLYSAPPLSSVLTMRSLYNEDGTPRLSIMTDLIPLAATNKTQATDPNLIMRVATDRIAAGKMTVDQAAQEISTLYQAIGKDNSEIKQYARFRIPVLSPTTIGLPPVGKSVVGFMQSVNSTGTFGGATPIDLMNATLVQNTLARMIASKKIGQQLLQGAVGGVP